MTAPTTTSHTFGSASATATTSAGGTLSRRPVVLVVDDDSLISESLRHVFLGQHYDLILCASGSEALGRFRREAVDVVISDLTMPGMSGLEFLERVREIDPDTQRILLTSEATYEVAARAVRSGLFTVLKKPFVVAEVRAIAIRAITRCQELRAQRRFGEQMQRSVLQSESIRIERDLYAGALHDLSGALTVITGLAETLGIDLRAVNLGGPPVSPAVIRQTVDDIKNQAEMCVEITQRSMRQLRHRHAGDRCDARAVLEDVTQLLRLHRSAKGHQLHVKLPDEGVSLQANAADIFRVVVNIALNAFQSSSRPHRVDLESWILREPLSFFVAAMPGEWNHWIRDGFENRPPCLAIAIRDDGPGIATEILPRLFNQVVTTKPEGEGTGLGLTVVRRTVNELGAALHVHSAEGQGTCFTLYLPLAS